MDQYVGLDVSQDETHICGTFDGFGSWSWDQFMGFLTAFKNKVNQNADGGDKLKRVALYEWQFVPPQWLPPGWADCLKEAGIPQQTKEGFSIITGNNNRRDCLVLVLVILVLAMFAGWRWYKR